MRRYVLGRYVRVRGQWPDWVKKICSLLWNSRAPVNFRASGINSRHVESRAVSLAFVCLVDFYLILTTVKSMHAGFFFTRSNYSPERCNHILTRTYLCPTRKYPL